MTSTTLATLPTIGAALAGGTFAGLTTLPNGTHHAVVLLPGKGDDLTWQQAGEWAAEQGGALPTRPVAALLFANAKAQLQPEWHWTADEHSASYAWYCYFFNGTQNDDLKSSEGSAVAVRLIPLSPSIL